MPLGHAGRNRSHADFGDQLDADARRRVRVLQVEDQLGQVFDRIDVVVRRRTDQTDARRGVPRRRNDLVHLVTGQLTPFTRLGTLRDLDLMLVGVGEVPGGDPEPAAGDLLDRGPLAVAVRQRREPFVVFASFAGVALPTDAVHGDREGFVRLSGDRAVAHRSGAEPLEDLGGRFDLFDRNRRGLLEPEPDRGGFPAAAPLR